jgi:head-tail adaptor
MPTLLFPKGGQFNRRIIIESQAAGVDSFGQPLDIWIEEFTCFAQIDPYVGLISGFAVKPTPDHAVAPLTINLRYGTGKNITTKMRARNLSSGAIYNILYVANPESAQRITQLACQVAT